MMKNLLWKVVLILATLVVFVWGIFLGTDPQKSIEAIKAHGLVAGVQQNIHLGLDLRGGTHLILQVQVNDAVNAETDQTIERLKDALKKKNIAYGDVLKLDPADNPQTITLRGVDIGAAGDLRSLISRPVRRIRPGLRPGQFLDRQHEADGAGTRSRAAPSSRPSKPSATASTSSASPSR